MMGHLVAAEHSVLGYTYPVAGLESELRSLLSWAMVAFQMSIGQSMVERKLQ